MNLIKRLAIGATTGAILLSSVTPAFAAANAWNMNVSNHSWAKAKAEDNDTYKVKVKNKDTYTFSVNKTVANTGGNVQKSKKGDGNILKTGDAWSEAYNYTEVNTTIITF